MSSVKRFILGLVFSVLVVLISSPASGQTLYELLERVVVEHDLIQAAEAGKEAADQNVRRAVGEWYPHVSATAEAGRESIDPPGD
jgi:outer membrane protein TolC